MTDRAKLDVQWNRSQHTSCVHAVLTSTWLHSLSCGVPALYNTENAGSQSLIIAHALLLSMHHASTTRDRIKFPDIGNNRASKTLPRSRGPGQDHQHCRCRHSRLCHRYACTCIVRTYTYTYACIHAACVCARVFACVCIYIYICEAPEEI